LFKPVRRVSNRRHGSVDFAQEIFVESNSLRAVIIGRLLDVVLSKSNNLKIH